MDEVVAKPIDLEIIKYILEEIIEVWTNLAKARANT